jgi:hypothetical protein
MTTATNSGLVDQQRLTPIYRMSLNAQLKLWQNAPAGMCSALLYSKEEIENALKLLDAKPDTTVEDQRQSFSDILQQCRPQEQVDWLTDHVLEEIPFFYIGDLFHCWASMYEEIITARPSVSKSLEDALHSELLTCKLMEKLADGVVPFDVAVRALCILALGNEANAKALAKLRVAPRALSGEETRSPVPASAMILTRCGEHAAKRAIETGAPVVSDELVGRSTMLLLAKLNKVSSTRRLLGLLPASGDAKPLAEQCSREWCQTRKWLEEASCGYCSSFCEDMTKQSKCSL